MRVPRSWRRFWTWMRYRRFLGDLVRDDRRNKIPPTPARIEELKEMARKAARLTGRGDSR